MSPSAPTIWLTTLGCAKNQVDSDKITGMLTSAGYTEAFSPESADVVMVNTCGFIEPARRESVDTILDLAGAKRDDASLVVVGCMAQRYEAELTEALPEADAVLGLDRYSELVDRLDALRRWTPLTIGSAGRSHMDILYETRRPTPTTPYAYVKVAEGCDKLCTFCAIPQFRGKQRSRSPENIRDEIAELTGAGVAEIGLVAQDLAAYGRDSDAPDIVELVRYVSDVDGLRRLRLYYLYPREIRPTLIEEMAGNPIVANYFDLSLQHASGRLLRAMKRPGSGDQHRILIDQIRSAAPDAAMRSSFIVGFPGEIDDDVDELASFLDDAQLDWAGFFPYSPEEGTEAAVMDDQVPDEEKQARLRHLQGIQDDITTARSADQIGRVLTIVIDQVEDGRPVARSYREAPEIDGVILLDRGEPGEWLTAEITGGYGIDLDAIVKGSA
ncbi:MAG: 30S ribosomal protein S12 methylthiotransferase RimO [Actinomycetota bacterium]|nr:30S ribosomal protein S12 methylthiotransferase RimO [Actinomycetota bacterium]